MAGEVPAHASISVDGVRLRYVESGAGTPVLLLHGNGSMIEDFVSSGLMDIPGYRFVAFDRPGFGYSERPRDRVWGPFEQARLLLSASMRLGIERPIVLGHSWGSLVALAMALERPDHVTGLVLLSGYYYPAPRPEIAVPATAFPFTGAVLRHAVVPFVRRMLAPNTLRRVFAPCPVPERFKQTYPLHLAMRSSQMRAVDEEAAMLADCADELCPFYQELSVPVCMMAGSNDLIVDTAQHSARLHLELKGSSFHGVHDCGHMVHHAVPGHVAAAIAGVAQARSGEALRRMAAEMKAPRQWLRIGESLAA
jgi:pimeloyl-ACP methyl ester carboxylesterase